MFTTIVIPFVIIALCNALIVSTLSVRFKHSNTNELESSVYTLNTGTPMLTRRNVNSNIKNFKFENKKNEASLYEKKQVNTRTQLTLDRSLSTTTTSKLGIANDKKASKKYSRTTKIVLIISTSFLIFNFPIAIFKSYTFAKHHTVAKNMSLFISSQTSNLSFTSVDIEYENNMSNYQVKSTLESFFEIISDDLYYFNFIFNFFFYSLSGSKFREALINNFNFKNIYDCKLFVNNFLKRK